MEANLQHQDEYIICSDVKPMNTSEMPISWYYLITNTAKSIQCKVFSPSNGAFGCFEPLVELVCHAAHATNVVGRNWPAMENIISRVEEDPKLALARRLVDELYELQETTAKHGTTDFNTMSELVDVLFFMMALGRERVNAFNIITRKVLEGDEVMAMRLLKNLAFVADDVVNEGYAADFAWIAIHKWYLRDINALNEKAFTKQSRFADMPCCAEFRSMANEIAGPITAAAVTLNIATGGRFQ